MFNPKRDKHTNRDKFYGFYRGEVIDVEDDLEVGRIKIEVFGVFDGLPSDQLPWAIYADPFMGGQEDLGGFFIPDVGSHVWVFFEEGDHTQPVYFAGAPAQPHGPSERSNGTYPRNKVFKTKAGHYFEIDDTDGENRIKLYHSSGTETEIDNDGNVDQLVVGDVTQKIEGDVDQTVEGDVTQVIEGNVDQTVKGNVDRLIEGNLTETINGNYSREIGGNSSDTISGNYTRDTSGNVDETAGGNIKFTGTRIDLN